MEKPILKEGKINKKSHNTHRTSQNSGITLVALIITIIVLLILAVVAIRAISNDGIISHAKNAQTGYEKAQAEEEQRLLEYEYQIASAQGTVTGTYDEYVLEKTYGLKIGDYVNYTYDTVSAGYSLSKAHSGYSSDKTITQPTTKLQWRVLGLDKNGNIELISATPAKSTYVYFKGAAGYNNGVYLLNDMCEKLYSNATLGIKARSLTIEDIEEQFSDAGKNARSNYTGNIKYGGTQSYDTNNKYPLIYAEEAGSGVNGTIREGGIGQSVPFYNKDNLTVAYDANGNAVKTAYTAASGNLNATQTYYYFSNTPSSYFQNEIFHNMIFGTGTYYWLASRYVRFSSSYAGFGLRAVNRASLDGSSLFYSDGNPDDGNCCLRPVVSLGSGVYVDTSAGDGLSPDSAYTIVKK